MQAGSTVDETFAPPPEMLSQKAVPEFSVSGGGPEPVGGGLAGTSGVGAPPPQAASRNATTSDADTDLFQKRMAPPDTVDKTGKLMRPRGPILGPVREAASACRSY